MKIYPSKVIKETLIGCAVLDLLCLLFFVVYCACFGFDWFFLLLLLFPMNIYKPFFLCPYKILLSHIIITENAVTSFVGKKQLCRVDLSDKVYYGVFSFRSRVISPTEKYIILSNSEITLKKPGFWGDGLLFRVDRENQVLIPYSARMQYFPDSRDWIYQHVE